MTPQRAQMMIDARDATIRAKNYEIKALRAEIEELRALLEVSEESERRALEQLERAKT